MEVKSLYLPWTSCIWSLQAKCPDDYRKMRVQEELNTPIYAVWLKDKFSDSLKKHVAPSYSGRFLAATGVLG